MRRWSNGLAALILVAMLGIGAANVVRVERSESAETVPGSDTVIESVQPDGPLTIEAAWLTANARANAWSAESSLMFASLQADWPLDPLDAGPAAMPPGGWARFAFIDASQDRVLSILIERYSGEIVSAESQPWDAGQVGPLPVAATAIDSENAVVIAESGYGQAWRLQCPIQRHETDVTLLSGAPPLTPGTDPAKASPAAMPAPPDLGRGSRIGSNGAPDPATPATTAVAAIGNQAAGSSTGPRWLVTYRDGTQPGLNSVEMEIDAVTGQILSIDDRSQGCSDSAG